MALNKRKVLEAARKHAQKGAKAKALKEYNKLLQEDARDAKLLLEVGDAYRRWGQNEEAIAQYGKVAQQYRQDGFDARAVAVFKQILNLDPKNYPAYVSLAELYERMGLDSEAATALQTAADGYHKEGRKTEALELLRQMVALDPTNTASRLKVAELLRQEGMESEALAEYQAVIGELTNQQDRDQLITVYERILEVRPDQIDALTELVRNLIAAGDLERAEPLAVRALHVSAEAPQFELLIDLYAQMGNESKLADATRGLAKLYRDRGDEEKARELMQRLPVEEVESSSRMAVDVSEVDEPELGDEELLADDEAFVELTDESVAEPVTPDALEGPEDLELELQDESPALDFGDADEEPGAVESVPLPEGDPDQLLAEASVYLRYGKREQAIASLRGVLAQDPNHRGALEKLGEAYVDDGQRSEAVHVWMQAAERMRSEGDDQALAVLKDRIGALDPAMAASIGPAPGASATTELPSIELDPDEISASVMDLDLDVEVEVEVEVDLDGAIGDVAASESGLEVGEELDTFEIELDEDSVAFDVPPVIEETAPELDSSSASENAVSLELEGDESCLDEAEAEVEVEFDFEELTGSASVSSAGQSTSTAAQISEELEEAEFYIAQEMYEEATGLLERILEIVPNHPAALLRMGEVGAARGEEPDAAVSGAESRTKDFEVAARFDEEPVGTIDHAEDDTDADSFDHDEDDEDAFEIDVEFDDDDEHEDDTVHASEDVPEQAVVQDAATEAVTDANVESDLCDDQSASSADEDSTYPGQVEVEAAATFDLREALADVLAEDDAPATDPNAESGVLSTVEDGFGSIFSDFKKGVSATLDAGDYDTRYDLGIAYREMGLYEDAIGEFRICLDSEERRFDSLYLMGLCARDLSRYEDAVNHLEQALALPDLPENRMAGVYFDLSFAEEAGGDLGRARASLRRVIELEAGFPGAADRLASLESSETPPPELGEPGEVYESFDDLFTADDDDEDGDEGVSAAVSVETFESFDDVVREAEAALDDADRVDGFPDAASSEVPQSGEADDPVDAEADTKPPKKGGRKKISFV